MRTREARSIQDTQRQHRHKSIGIYTDIESKPKSNKTIQPGSSLTTAPFIDAPRTLSPFTFSDMNSLNGCKTTSTEYTNSMRTTNGANTNGTIRSVPSDSLQLDLGYLDEDTPPRRSSTKPDSPMPHSTSLPAIPGPRGAPPLAWQNLKLGIGNGVVRKMSSEFGPSKLYAGAVHVVESNNSSANGGDANDSSSGDGRCSCGHVCGQGEGGKSTSKFIERVMSERDSYKRDLAAERLKFKEVNDTLDFAKAKMDKTISEHESEIHDAMVNKTLLKRKERQLEDMKLKFEAESRRADAAVEMEKIMKAETDVIRAESRKKVEDAEDHAAMFQAQINTMTNHWQEKQAELDKQEARLMSIMTDFTQLIKVEAEKAKRLETICDQYRAENERLSKLNQASMDTYEQYKVTTEDSLKDIKSSGATFDADVKTLLNEATDLRDKLKWSINVSKNFKDLPSAVDALD